MSDAVLDQVRSMVADIFNCKLDQVTPASSSESIEGWDSLHHLNLVIALEEQFGISIDPWQALAQGVITCELKTSPLESLTGSSS